MYACMYCLCTCIGEEDVVQGDQTLPERDPTLLDDFDPDGRYIQKNYIHVHKKYT